MNFLFYYGIVALIVCSDQLVKWVVVDQIPLFDRIPLIDGVLTLTNIRNTGAAYNLFSQMHWLLVVFPGLVMVLGLIFIALKHKTANGFLMTSISMIIGGGLGNLIDRIHKGYVVDFLDIRVIPVFNVADICITVGCCMLFVYLIFMDGKRRVKS